MPCVLHRLVYGYYYRVEFRGRLGGGDDTAQLAGHFLTAGRDEGAVERLSKGLESQAHRAL